MTFKATVGMCSLLIPLWSHSIEYSILPQRLKDIPPRAYYPRLEDE